ncbi:MAG: hypothetical protein DMF75_06360 [Acidobacteria bacterium]|nr:MAG: hypothetical protein DMF75_06360 [Acidobacteriota bacterium]
MKKLIFMSKPASYFVGRFSPVGPNAENFVVRNALLPATWGIPFKVLQFFDYLRGSFRVSDAETALPLEGQFDHNFSHGAELLSGHELYHMIIRCSGEP